MGMTDRSPNTAEQILDVAGELAQTRGYNAFSYRDLAQQVGIRTASIHHHFPTKADLGQAVIRRYRERFAEALQGIDAAGLDPSAKLRAYVGLYRQTVGSDCGVCLGGMLAAELLTLAPEVQAELQAFFDDGEAWLQGVLRAGADSGELHFSEPAEDAALAIVSALQGAMIIARAHGDVANFDRASRWLVESFNPPS